ncbi:SGNH/GDSL hydrolase family protein [Geodermatophilus sp. SYSU D01105]
MFDRSAPRRGHARTTLAVLALVLAQLLGGCALWGDGDERVLSAPQPGSQVPAGPSATTPSVAGTGMAAPGPEVPAPSTFAVVGDSITAGGAVISDRHVEGEASWVPAAAESSGLTFVGGWAVPGATTGDMLRAQVPADADVVVVMAGTNDVLQDRPWDESADNLTRLAAAATAAGVDTVVVSAIAPNDVDTPGRQAYNAALASLATQRGWVLVDPWGEIDDDGRFAPGTTTDGTHLPPEVAASVGTRLGEQLAELG